MILSWAGKATSGSKADILGTTGEGTIRHPAVHERNAHTEFCCRLVDLWLRLFQQSGTFR